MVTKPYRREKVPTLNIFFSSKAWDQRCEREGFGNGAIREDLLGVFAKRRF